MGQFPGFSHLFVAHHTSQFPMLFTPPGYTRRGQDDGLVSGQHLALVTGTSKKKHGNFQSNVIYGGVSWFLALDFMMVIVCYCHCGFSLW